MTAAIPVYRSAEADLTLKVKSLERLVVNLRAEAEALRASATEERLRKNQVIERMRAELLNSKKENQELVQKLTTIHSSIAAGARMESVLQVGDHPTTPQSPTSSKHNLFHESSANLLALRGRRRPLLAKGLPATASTASLSLGVGATKAATVQHEEYSVLNLETFARLKKAFDRLDVDGSGSLSFQEIRANGEIIGGRHIDHVLFKKIDRDRSGYISFLEMCRFWFPDVPFRVLQSYYSELRNNDAWKTIEAASTDEAQLKRNMMLQRKTIEKATREIRTKLREGFLDIMKQQSDRSELVGAGRVEETIMMGVEASLDEMRTAYAAKETYWRTLLTWKNTVVDRFRWLASQYKTQLRDGGLGVSPVQRRPSISLSTSSDDELPNGETKPKTAEEPKEEAPVLHRRRQGPSAFVLSGAKFSDAATMTAVALTAPPPAEVYVKALEMLEAERTAVQSRILTNVSVLRLVISQDADVDMSDPLYVSPEKAGTNSTELSRNVNRLRDITNQIAHTHSNIMADLHRAWASGAPVACDLLPDLCSRGTATDPKLTNVFVNPVSKDEPKVQKRKVLKRRRVMRPASLSSKERTSLLLKEAMSAPEESLSAAAKAQSRARVLFLQHNLLLEKTRDLERTDPSASEPAKTALVDVELELSKTLAKVFKARRDPATSILVESINSLPAGSMTHAADSPLLSPRKMAEDVVASVREARIAALRAPESHMATLHQRIEDIRSGLQLEHVAGPNQEEVMSTVVLTSGDAVLQSPDQRAMLTHDYESLVKERIRLNDPKGVDFEKCAAIDAALLRIEEVLSRPISVDATPAIYDTVKGLEARRHIQETEVHLNFSALVDVLRDSRTRLSAGDTDAIPQIELILSSLRRDDGEEAQVSTDGSEYYESDMEGPTTFGDAASPTASFEFPPSALRSSSSQQSLVMKSSAVLVSRQLAPGHYEDFIVQDGVALVSVGVQVSEPRKARIHGEETPSSPGVGSGDPFASFADNGGLRSIMKTGSRPNLDAGASVASLDSLGSGKRKTKAKAKVVQLQAPNALTRVKSSDPLPNVVQTDKRLQAERKARARARKTAIGSPHSSSDDLDTTFVDETRVIASKLGNLKNLIASGSFSTSPRPDSNASQDDDHNVDDVISYIEGTIHSATSAASGKKTWIDALDRKRQSGHFDGEVADWLKNTYSSGYHEEVEGDQGAEGQSRLSFEALQSRRRSQRGSVSKSGRPSPTSSVATAGAPSPPPPEPEVKKAPAPEEPKIVIHRRPLRPADPQYNAPDVPLVALPNLDEWSFDIFAACQRKVGKKTVRIHSGSQTRSVRLRVGHNILFHMALNVFNAHGLFEHFDVDLHAFANFVHAIESGYKATNPYHNAVHAADVLHATHVMLLLSGLDRKLSPLECFATLFAAMVHDYQHPGVNNALLGNTAHAVAMRYNDNSILENHHISSAFALERTMGLDLLSCLSDAFYKKFRKLVTDMVLATDMTVHFSNLDQLKNRATTGLNLSSEDDRVLLIRTIIHSADISNPARAEKVYLAWTHRVNEEFWMQGRVEEALGLPFSPLCNPHPDKINVAMGQIGFISFIVRPTFSTLTDCFGVPFEPIMAEIQTNLAYWQRDQVGMNLKFIRDHERSLNELKDILHDHAAGGRPPYNPCLNFADEDPHYFWPFCERCHPVNAAVVSKPHSLAHAEPDPSPPQQDPLPAPTGPPVVENPVEPPVATDEKQEKVEEPPKALSVPLLNAVKQDLERSPSKLMQLSMPVSSPSQIFYADATSALVTPAAGERKDGDAAIPDKSPASSAASLPAVGDPEMVPVAAAEDVASAASTPRSVDALSEASGKRRYSLAGSIADGQGGYLHLAPETARVTEFAAQQLRQFSEELRQVVISELLACLDSSISEDVKEPRSASGLGMPSAPKKARVTTAGVVMRVSTKLEEFSAKLLSKVIAKVNNFSAGTAASAARRTSRSGSIMQLANSASNVSLPFLPHSGTRADLSHLGTPLHAPAGESFDFEPANAVQVPFFAPVDTKSLDASALVRRFSPGFVGSHVPGRWVSHQLEILQPGRIERYINEVCPSPGGIQAALRMPYIHLWLYREEADRKRPRRLTHTYKLHRVRNGVNDMTISRMICAGLIVVLGVTGDDTMYYLEIQPSPLFEAAVSAYEEALDECASSLPSVDAAPIAPAQQTLLMQNMKSWWLGMQPDPISNSVPKDTLLSLLAAPALSSVIGRLSDAETITNRYCDPNGEEVSYQQYLLIMLQLVRQ